MKMSMLVKIEKIKEEIVDKDSIVPSKNLVFLMGLMIIFCGLPKSKVENLLVRMLR